MPGSLDSQGLENLALLIQRANLAKHRVRWLPNKVQAAEQGEKLPQVSCLGTALSSRQVLGGTCRVECEP